MDLIPAWVRPSDRVWAIKRWLEDGSVDFLIVKGTDSAQVFAPNVTKVEWKRVGDFE
jgi:hypothetical protein